MAKIQSAFQCILCKEPLHFPNDVDIMEFIILLLQFYKTHNLCENREKTLEPLEISAKKPRKKRSPNKK